MIDATTTITVNGARKSESAGRLDDGEHLTFTIRPGQYDNRIYSVDNQLNQIYEQAFYRGEWISSFKFESIDIVQNIIEDLL